MTYDTDSLVAFYKILARRELLIPVDLTAKLLAAGIDVSAIDAELTELTPNYLGDDDYGLSYNC